MMQRATTSLPVETTTLLPLSVGELRFCSLSRNPSYLITRG
jgi:hypothetical protein